MLKKIILIENDKEYQCDTMQEVVKKLIDENYYNFTQEEKINKMKMLALANCLNNKKEIIEEYELDTNFSIERKFIIKDEMTYVLSLLLTNNIILLERIDSNVFTKDLDKSNFNDNYIIVNKFAEMLLQKYINKQERNSL